MKGFCTECGKNVEMQEVKPRRLPNMIEVYEGKCPVCENQILKKRSK
jgi:endogenous inhibitor of DNA gyrase (YacG/DUF329 family)